MPAYSYVDVKWASCDSADSLCTVNSQGILHLFVDFAHSALLLEERPFLLLLQLLLLLCNCCRLYLRT